MHTTTIHKKEHDRLHPLVDSECGNKLKAASLTVDAQPKRITFSRLTIIYFSFSLLHFAAQIAIQSTAFDANLNALNALTNLVANKSMLNDQLPIMQGSTLKFCTMVPANLETSGCAVVWNGTNIVTGSAAINSTDAVRSATNRHPDDICQRSLLWPISE